MAGGGRAGRGDFPLRVHFAWELPEDSRKGLKARIRRITYELGPIGAATKPGQSKDGMPRRAWIYGTDGEPVLIVGDRLDADTGTIRRTYPRAPNQPSGITCYLSDAEWLLDDLKGGHDVYNLPENKAAYRVRSDGEVLDKLDLIVDFLPVVHITNTIPDAGEHWGQPILAKVIQGLDEIAATDTDSSAASATTGSPILTVSGANLPVDRTTGQPQQLTATPGMVLSLREGGSMDVLDTSKQLAELRNRTDHLIERVATNSRITAAGLGTIDPTALPCGYALRCLWARWMRSSGSCVWLGRTSTPCCSAWSRASTRPAGSGLVGRPCPPALRSAPTPRPTGPRSWKRSSRPSVRGSCRWRPVCGCSRTPDTRSRTPPKRSPVSRPGRSSRPRASPTPQRTMLRCVTIWGCRRRVPRSGRFRSCTPPGEAVPEEEEQRVE
ncbi:hypothetical protein ACFRQM_47635 [Streptomyces sp. NPDC056831]|uniref:hypothetical protein n=1 Tax=Streptomyces sp. NPDC056831 TaxID=3345954 RepID=UPI00367D488F